MSSVGIVVYDTELLAADARHLSLSVTVPGLRMQSGSGTTTVGPYAFDLVVPVTSGQTLTLDRTATAGRIELTLDRVVASPSETRIYLRSSPAFGPADQYMSARIVGENYDTSSLVITSPSELVGLGSTFQAPDGEQVVTFNNTLFGRRGDFTLTISSIGTAQRIVGPWTFHFVVP